MKKDLDVPLEQRQYAININLQDMDHCSQILCSEITYNVFLRSGQIRNTVVPPCPVTAVVFYHPLDSVQAGSMSTKEDRFYARYQQLSFVSLVELSSRVDKLWLYLIIYCVLLCIYSIILKCSCCLLRG